MDKISENLDKLSFTVSNFLSLNLNSSQENSKLSSLALFNPFEIHFAKRTRRKEDDISHLRLFCLELSFHRIEANKTT